MEKIYRALMIIESLNRGIDPFTEKDFPSDT
jgi:hypothetical protein